MSARVRLELTQPAEPMVLQISKAILYIAAITAYLVFFTSEWAMWVSLMLGGLALI